MTSEDLRSELDKNPFIPLRLHLVSGKMIDIPRPGIGFMLQNAVMILHDPRRTETSFGSYDVIALRNIEMVEQLIA